MKIIALLLYILTSLSIYANDTVMVITGDTLHPITTTNVSMDYERLNIICKSPQYEIEVYIELYNHDEIILEPLIGFEFYKGTSDRFEIDSFKKFIVMINNEPQKFEYKYISSDNEFENYHMLLYTPKLNPGKNIVYHKYSLPYRMSSGAEVKYILTTGSHWKDGIIKNLEIFIRTERNNIVNFRESRNRENSDRSVLSFDTIGKSKLYKTYDYTNDNHDEYYSLTPDGYLYKNMRDFTPDRNIVFELYAFTGLEQYYSEGYYDSLYNWPRENPFITIYDWRRYIEDPNFRRYRWHDEFIPSEKMLEELSIEELRILRNSIYAIHGYVFNDNLLKNYFNNQYWYFPNPNMIQSDIVLEPSEQKILEYIISEERRR
jgi:hypothetical protein